MTSIEIPKGKVIRATDIPVSVGHPTPAQHKKWLNQQIVYKNYAGHSDHLDQIVAATVINRREEFYTRMSRVMERWETIWDAANGNPFWGEWDDDIHVPETRKMLDGKVARIEEALFEFQPLFGVEGTRGDLPRWKAQIIESYVFRIMQLGDYESFIQPLARDCEISNIAALKLRWDFEYEMVVDRSWELKERPDGTPYWRDERRIRDAVTSQGVRYSMVDPFLFWYDLDCGNLDSNECGYVGDDSDQFVHDLQRMGKAGLFSEKNLKLVKERKAGGGHHQPQHRAEWPDQRRAARSIAVGPNFSMDTKGEHDARKVRCSEVWMWFDFGDGFDDVTDPLGRRITDTHKVVITLANGIPIQFRLNPHDKKFHPYAIGRITRNGHESVAPSQFEQVANVNSQYDRYRSNVLRHSDLTVAPMLAVRGPFPTDNLLGVKAGQVFDNVGDVHEIKVGDVPSSVQYFDNFFRREHEEASGVLRVFESPEGTATAVERKVQEQQRMVRPSIRANGQLWKSAALKTLWIAAQYSTGPQRFAVMGKASQVLGTSFEITPDVMQEDVDIHFHGIQSMHVFGDRASGMAQWSNRWGPMLETMPEINKLELARQDYELSVGRHNVNDIFANHEPAWNSWPQPQENEMLLSGKKVNIHESDDHLQHIRDMSLLVERMSDLPAYVQELIREHLDFHVIAYEQQQQQEQELSRRKEMERMMTGGTPGQDRPPEAGGMMAGGAQMPGITPGPPQERTVARTGREGQGMSQTQLP